MSEIGQKPKILLVDDKPQNLYAMEKLLQSLEVEVVLTTSSSDVLALTLEHDFCLTIVDVQMPAQSAFNLLGNLLTWSRMQRSLVEYKPQRINLNDLVNSTVDLLAETAVSKNIQPSLPRTPNPKLKRQLEEG